jgi:hypothetical protein
MNNIATVTPIDTGRILRLTPASEIDMKPIRWMWDGRIPLGMLSLLAGREGVGKSTVAYTIAAHITKGTLHGQNWGLPKSVIIAATEDSWEHVIAPRLTGAGADLDRIFRVEVVEVDTETSLILPADIKVLEEAVVEQDVALVILDPLISRLHASLDSHKDQEVRQALEPLTAMADRCQAAVLGIIHVNKGGSGDAVNQIMGSRAFGAVARSALFAMKSPDDENVKMLGVPKNNLGPPVMTKLYRLEGVRVGGTDDDPITTSRVEWIGDVEMSVNEALELENQTGDGQSNLDEAKVWLLDFLTSKGGSALSSEVKVAGRQVEYSERTLKRAAKKLSVIHEAFGFPRQTLWKLPLGPTAVGPGANSEVMSKL